MCSYINIKTIKISRVTKNISFKTAKEAKLVYFYMYSFGAKDPTTIYY